jgi:hypothetical protein
VTKGPKAPFAKPRTAPAKTKPDDWTEERWPEDCLWRKLSTAERRGRRVLEQDKKKTSSLVLQKAARVAATAAGPWSSSTNAYILGLAPSTPGFFGEAAVATPGCLAPASASTSSSVVGIGDGAARRAEHDEFFVLDGPTSTQDAPSAAPNPFF